MVSLQVNTVGIMAMNRMDRIVLDPVRTYACTRTARTGVRVTPAANLPVVPTPTTDMISSFISHHRKRERDGIAVGKTSLQDLETFARENRIGKQIYSTNTRSLTS